MKREMAEILQKTQAAVEGLLAIAESADSICEDDGCRVLVGVVRDSAYRIRREIERELRVHGLSQGRPRSSSAFTKK